MGNQLMLDRDPDYPANAGRRYRVSEHTVAAVARTLQTLSLPGSPWCDALPEGVTTAVDVFAGYVMLDAWIANQDRHHENWAGHIDYFDELLGRIRDIRASERRVYERRLESTRHW
jgi:hypothetical protein